jgi:electron transfer flavoprotein alpha subunit
MAADQPVLSTCGVAPVVVQVLAESDQRDHWTGMSLELLGDASALARRWTGQVGAWVLTGPKAAVPQFDELSAHGCQAICHLINERFTGWSSEAVAAALAKHMPPGCRIVLLPGTARGEEVAALLAQRLETAWVPDALTLAVTRSGELDITATVPGGKLSRVCRPAGDRPVIVTMRQGVAEVRKVDKPGSLEVRRIEVDLSSVAVLTKVERYLPADPRTIDIIHAQRIVSAGRGTGGPDGIRLVASFADALGASFGASRLAVDLGWAPPERQVGQTGKTVRPDLYVACGISGATHHLAGMRESKHIVAINPDAAAPIHDVAHLSLRDDLHRLIPAIQAALQRRFANSSATSQT